MTVTVPSQPTPKIREAIEAALSEVLAGFRYVLPADGADRLYAAAIAGATAPIPHSQKSEAE